MNLLRKKSLNMLEVGSVGIIVKITADHELKQRLLSLGFIKGNQIKLISSSFARETFVVDIGSKTQYALRGTEAKYILVTVNVEC